MTAFALTPPRPLPGDVSARAGAVPIATSYAVLGSILCWSLLRPRDRLLLRRDTHGRRLRRRWTQRDPRRAVHSATITSSSAWWDGRPMPWSATRRSRCASGPIFSVHARRHGGHGVVAPIYRRPLRIVVPVPCNVPPPHRHFADGTWLRPGVLLNERARCCCSSRQSAPEVPAHSFSSMASGLAGSSTRPLIHHRVPRTRTCAVVTGPSNPASSSEPASRSVQSWRGTRRTSWTTSCLSALGEYGHQIDTAWLATAPIDQTIVPAMSAVGRRVREPVAHIGSVGRRLCVTHRLQPLAKAERTGTILCSGVVATCDCLLVHDAITWCCVLQLSPRFVLHARGFRICNRAGSRLDASDPRFERLLWSQRSAYLPLPRPTAARRARFSREMPDATLPTRSVSGPALDSSVRSPRVSARFFEFHLGRAVTASPPPAEHEGVRVCTPRYTSISLTLVPPTPVSCTKRAGTRHYRFEQLTRGRRIDVLVSFLWEPSLRRHPVLASHSWLLTSRSVRRSCGRGSCTSGYPRRTDEILMTFVYVRKEPQRDSRRASAEPRALRAACPGSRVPWWVSPTPRFACGRPCRSSPASCSSYGLLHFESRSTVRDPVPLPRDRLACPPRHHATGTRLRTLAFLAMSVLVVVVLRGASDRGGHGPSAPHVRPALSAPGLFLLFGIAFVATAAVLLAVREMWRAAAVGLVASLAAIACWYAPHIGAVRESSQIEDGVQIGHPWVVTAPIDQILLPGC